MMFLVKGYSPGAARSLAGSAAESAGPYTLLMGIPPTVVLNSGLRSELCSAFFSAIFTPDKVDWFYDDAGPASPGSCDWRPAGCSKLWFVLRRADTEQRVESVVATPNQIDMSMNQYTGTARG